MPAHGLHRTARPPLTLATDTLIAETFTRHLIAAHGEPFDLWQLPALPYSIAPEHAWAPAPCR
ncbi:hypothetical protein [Streptomyces wedmorensis]